MGTQDNVDKIGTAVTVDNDSRITKVGVKLRDLRMDELSQLFDVIVGNMSFVGTRPEAVKYVKQHTNEMYATLLLPAGITSEASIMYKDEASLLNEVQDVDKVYVEEVLPKKMLYNLDRIFSIIYGVRFQLCIKRFLLFLEKGLSRLNKKKILIVCTTDSMIWNFLIPHIFFLREKQIEVECVCSKTGFYYDELVDKYNIKLHEINFARNPIKKQNINAYKQLSNLIKINGYDVIYGHEPVGGAMARLAGKRNHKYVIYIAHGFHFFNKAPIKHWILYFSFEYILSFLTDAIVTICKEDFLHAKKLHAKRCYYIPGIGVDFSKFKIADKDYYNDRYRKEIGIKTDDIVLLSVGELSIRKNHKVIIEALAKLKDDKNKLVLCGEGNQEEKLKKICIQYGVEESVFFLGFRRDVANVLCMADIFIFPSLWEGLGLAGIEAMYNQLPVIGSNRQGIKDYVINGETGYLFEPMSVDDLVDKIDKLSKNEKLRISLGENGKNKAELYSLNNSKKALERIYIKESII